MIRFYHECVVLSYHAFAIGVLALVVFGMRFQRWLYCRLSMRTWKNAQKHISPEERKEMEDYVNNIDKKN